MSNPLDGGIPFPQPNEQKKTVMYQDGHNRAVLLTPNGDSYDEQILAVSDAEHVLAFCRSEGYAMVYLPPEE